jgi:Flp pilus assembly pilin Flp
MMSKSLQLWKDASGQDIAEYAVMLAVILVLVVGTTRLVGSNANNAYARLCQQRNPNCGREKRCGN